MAPWPRLPKHSHCTVQWIHAVTLSLQVLRVPVKCSWCRPQLLHLLGNRQVLRVLQVLEILRRRHGTVFPGHQPAHHTHTHHSVPWVEVPPWDLPWWLFPPGGDRGLHGSLARRTDHSLHLVACHFGGFLRSHEGLGYLNTAIMEGM